MFVHYEVSTPALPRSTVECNEHVYLNSNQLLLPHPFVHQYTAALCYEFYFYSFSGLAFGDVDNVVDRTCKGDLWTEQWEELKMTLCSALLYSSGKLKSCTREDFIIIYYFLTGKKFKYRQQEAV